MAVNVEARGARDAVLTGTVLSITVQRPRRTVADFDSQADSVFRALSRSTNPPRSRSPSGDYDVAHRDGGIQHVAQRANHQGTQQLLQLLQRMPTHCRPLSGSAMSDFGSSAAASSVGERPRPRALRL